MHTVANRGVLIGIVLVSSAFGQEDRAHSEAMLQAEKGNHAAAVKLLDQSIRENPQHAEAYYWRGRSRFCQAQVKESVADFDHFVRLQPKAESRQWERGIALYYVGEFERGAKQFELYQTYHDNDVENSVWRYLCVARHKGVAEARKSILPIKNDRRVPMKAIYDLYHGEATPDDVQAAVEAGAPDERERNQRAFYAHLYLGLWYEAAEKPDLAKKHMVLAERHRIGHYMWDVARVHNELRRVKE